MCAWRSYLNALRDDEKELFTIGGRPFVRSKFYHGVIDKPEFCSLAMRRMDSFEQLTLASTLSIKELRTVFHLVEKEWWVDVLSTLVQKVDYVSEDELWAIVKDAWNGSVDEHVDTKRWVGLFDLLEPSRKLLREYEDGIEIWRAGESSGISWTKSKLVASRYAELKMCEVINGKVYPSDVFFINQSRNEMEVVIKPGAARL